MVVSPVHTIDPSRGGATRDEVDALRLMAVFLHHWDNKSSNQRLTCVGPTTPDCAHPLAMIQDVGSEFGPESRPRQMAIDAGLARCIKVPGYDETPCRIAAARSRTSQFPRKADDCSPAVCVSLRPGRLKRSSRRRRSKTCPRGRPCFTTASGRSSTARHAPLRKLCLDDCSAIVRSPHILKQ